MPRPRSPIQQLYERLLQSGEIPIAEAPDIFSKGLYWTEDEKKEIYIKQSLNYREKLKVLLHEYSHHIHLTHHFKHESRAECEIIANRDRKIPACVRFLRTFSPTAKIMRFGFFRLQGIWIEGLQRSRSIQVF